MNIYDEMVEIFNKYNIKNSQEGCERIYDNWLDAKKPLINILSKHPNWVPDKYYIKFDTDWAREPDAEKINRFFIYVSGQLGYGKWQQIRFLSRYYEQYISQDVAEVLNSTFPELKVRKGQKTSKVVRQILLSLGFSEKEKEGDSEELKREKREFRQRYADYSDAINPLQVKRHTVISVNLIDYLLSSNGNSWSSCHTLDKNNPNGYQGMHCSGSLSYALDSTTIVFYQVDEEYDGENLELEPKIIRQMFHYNEGILVQGRLYPQCNDGKNSLYIPTREIMQKIFADILGEPNLWIRKKGTQICKAYCCTEGTNYPDYLNNEECSMSRLYTHKKFSRIKIGGTPICPDCGKTHTVENSLNCKRCVSDYYCQECGEPLEEEDVIWIDDKPYCSNCVGYCVCCEKYHLIDETNYYEELGFYICDGCAEAYYNKCDNCGHLVADKDVVIDANGNCYCQSCAVEILIEVDDELYPASEVRTCSECGKLFVGEGEICEKCLEEIENEKE